MSLSSCLLNVVHSQTRARMHASAHTGIHPQSQMVGLGQALPGDPLGRRAPGAKARGGAGVAPAHGCGAARDVQVSLTGEGKNDCLSSRSQTAAAWDKSWGYLRTSCLTPCTFPQPQTPHSPQERPFLPTSPYLHIEGDTACWAHHLSPVLRYLCRLCIAPWAAQKSPSSLP